MYVSCKGIKPSASQMWPSGLLSGFLLHSDLKLTRDIYIYTLFNQENQ